MTDQPQDMSIEELIDAMNQADDLGRPDMAETIQDVIDIHLDTEAAEEDES